jgi:hypothetical protein
MERSFRVTACLSAVIVRIRCPLSGFRLRVNIWLASDCQKALRLWTGRFLEFVRKGDRNDSGFVRHID